MRVAILALLLAILFVPDARAQTGAQIMESKVYFRQPGNEAVVQVTVANYTGATLKDLCVEVRLVPGGGGPVREYRERAGTLSAGKQKSVRIYTGLTGAKAVGAHIQAADGTYYRVQVAAPVGSASALPALGARPAAPAGGTSGSTTVPGLGNVAMKLADTRLRTPSSGGSITVVARVRNEGDQKGQARVSCVIRDSGQRQLYSSTQSVEVPPGATVDVLFPTRFSSRMVLDTSGTSFLADTDTYGAPTHSSIMKVDVQVR